MSDNAAQATDFSGRFSGLQRGLLFLLRIAIGWHFLYEGVVKLANPDWSAAGYLAASRGPFSGIFHWMASSPAVLGLVDTLNTWGLILIGLGLMFGLLTRWAALAGVLLIGFYYLANPPFIEMSRSPYTEGNYLLVDKNLVEMIALGLIAFFPSHASWGLDRLLMMRGKKPSASEQEGREEPKRDGTPEPTVALDRRELLKNLATVPVFGAFVFSVMKKYRWESWEEKNLLSMAGADPDAVTSATIKTFHFASLKDLEGTMPKGKIGDLELSRMIAGGNLIGGWAHARDLIYVSKLVKAYHHDQKVFETLRLAEQCGVNTILTNPALCRVINEYWRKEGGTIQFISDCAFEGDVMKGIRVSVDGGAHACYVQGGITDNLLKEGRIDEVGEAVEYARSLGVPAGIGAHDLESVKECVRRGFTPDFWVKTLHRTDYWSSDPVDQHDNIWCTNPDETVAYMESLEQPWIAFKILAAGALKPEEAFPYAFESGADFICVGMYDFQIVEDVNLANRILAGDINRRRPWRA